MQNTRDKVMFWGYDFVKPWQQLVLLTINVMNRNEIVISIQKTVCECVSLILGLNSFNRVTLLLKSTMTSWRQKIIVYDLVFLAFLNEGNMYSICIFVVHNSKIHPNWHLKSLQYNARNHVYKFMHERAFSLTNLYFK